MSEPTLLENSEEQKTIMRIILTKDGEILVSGMIDDKTMALGILECAKLKLIDYWKSLEAQVVKPSNRMMSFVRGKK